MTFIDGARVTKRRIATRLPEPEADHNNSKQVVLCTPLRALGTELIPISWQSVHR